MFTWKEAYKVNNVMIDNQHKKLFLMGQAMSELVQSHEGEDIYDELIQMFNELVDYTEYHFTEEEKLMEAAGYENLASHKVEHQKFVDKLHDFDLSAMDDHQSEFAMKLLKTVATWIFKHITAEDFLYRPLLEDK